MEGNFVKPKITIILGSSSDYKICEKTINTLEKLKIPYDVKVASAHRTPQKLKYQVSKATEEGTEVFIGIAGLSAQLPGIITSYTHKPVIAVPVDVKVGGLDALLTSSQMPFPEPVATVGINNGVNAAILAAQILAVHDKKVKERLISMKKDFYEKIIKSEEEITEKIKGKYYSPQKIETPEFEITTPDSNSEIDVCVMSGSYSDMNIVRRVTSVLDRADINYDLRIVFPFRRPDKFEELIKNMNTKIFISVTGVASHITGMLASLTLSPVIGVPCTSQLQGLDSLLSMVNMPPGVPVATVGINRGDNAAMLALEILAMNNEELEEKIKNIKWKRS